MDNTEQIVRLLSDLSAFNKLDSMMVNIISGVFGVDAKEICRENGITYWLEKKKPTPRLSLYKRIKKYFKIK